MKDRWIENREKILKCHYSKAAKTKKRKFNNFPWDVFKVDNSKKKNHISDRQLNM